MEKDAPKGGPFGIPPNLACLLLWLFTPRAPQPVAVKKPPVFCGPLVVRRFSCPISRRLLPSDNGSTAYSVRRWEQSEPDGGGKALPRERTTGRSSCPLWVYKGPCPLLALSPISVHTEMGPSETRPPLRSGKYGRRRHVLRYAAESMAVGDTSSQSPLCLGLPPGALDPLPCSSFPPLRWALPGPPFPLGSGEYAPGGGSGTINHPPSGPRPQPTKEDHL